MQTPGGCIGPFADEHLSNEVYFNNDAKPLGQKNNKCGIKDHGITDHGIYPRKVSS